jgi:hypothetical protein
MRQHLINAMIAIGFIGIIYLGLRLLASQQEIQSNEPHQMAEAELESDLSAEAEGEPFPVVEDLNELFPKETRSYSEPFPFTIRSKQIALLHVPNGRLSVADVFFTFDTQALDIQVEPGDYPVVLSLIRTGNNDWEENAASKVVFADGEVVRWERAFYEGDKPEDFGEGMISAFATDSATAAFFSPESGQEFTERMDTDFDAYLQEIIDVTAAHQNEGSWAVLYPKADSPNNLVAFAPGYKDGRYGSYLGYDAEGKLLCVVAEFELFNIRDLPLGKPDAK